MTTQRDIIAIIEDDLGLGSALGVLLSAYGYQSKLFSSAEEFIAVAATSNAACLLVDVELGGMSGLNLARRLIAAGVKYPLIFMTGSHNDEYRRQATDLGCVAYLKKPYPSAILMEAITAATGIRPNRVD